jgi:hypothetical protein
MCSEPTTGPLAADCLHEAISFCTIMSIVKETGVRELPVSLMFACIDSVWMYIQHNERRLWKRLQRIKTAVQPAQTHS